MGHDFEAEVRDGQIWFNGEAYDSIDVMAEAAMDLAAAANVACGDDPSAVFRGLLDELSGGDAAAP
jgi:hypothetical protein